MIPGFVKLGHLAIGKPAPKRTGATLFSQIDTFFALASRQYCQALVLDMSSWARISRADLGGLVTVASERQTPVAVSFVNIPPYLCQLLEKNGAMRLMPTHSTVELALQHAAFASALAGTCRTFLHVPSGPSRLAAVCDQVASLARHGFRDVTLWGPGSLTDERTRIRSGDSLGCRIRYSHHARHWIHALHAVSKDTDLSQGPIAVTDCDTPVSTRCLTLLYTHLLENKLRSATATGPRPSDVFVLHSPKSALFEADLDPFRNDPALPGWPHALSQQAQDQATEQPVPDVSARETEVVALHPVPTIFPEAIQWRAQR